MSRLTRSQRSGAPIEPDKPVTVKYVFESGERREVRITAAEADDLLTQGDDRTSRWSRAWRAAWLWVKPPGKWLLAVVLGGLLGAWISDSYADRQRELELESSLITQISGGAIKLFQDAQEASRATTDPMQRVQRDRAADAWVLLSGSITPVFRAYFEDKDVADHWDDYQAAMYDWAVLGCCADDRPALIARIRNYVDDRKIVPPQWEFSGDPWLVLEGADPTPAAYQWLGRTLLRGRGKILLDLKAANPDLD